MNFCHNNIFILFFLVLGYLLYKDLTKKEGFDTTDDIKAAVKTLYNADIQAIRNLSDIATKLVAGGLTVPGNILLQMNNVIDFGSNDTTRETNAGKIGYDKFGDNLSIVGKGKPGEPRRIRLWDNVEVGNNLNTPSTTYGVSKDGVSSTITDSKFEGNSLCIVGQDNPAGGRKITMWDNVQINGNLNINGGKIKIGSWTIQEDNGHLQFIKDGTVYTKGNAQYNDIPVDTGFSAITQDGNIWINRSIGRGWIGNNTGEALNQIQYVNKKSDDALNISKEALNQILVVDRKSEDALKQIQNVNKKSDDALYQSNDTQQKISDIQISFNTLMQRINK